jgi:hypothetical protein
MKTEFWPSLKADDDDRADWLALFKTPFDPSVEIVRRDEQEFFILKASALAGLPDSVSTFEAAKPLVRQLNGLVTAQTGAPSRVEVISVVEKIDGKYAQHAIVMLGTAEFVIRGHPVSLVVRDKGGNPPPPAPTIGQEAYRASTLDAHVADAATYLADRPDWFDLFKAFECLEAGNLVSPNVSKVEIKRFTHTANSLYRHRIGGFKPPSNPLTLKDAKALLNRLMRDAVETVLARSS